MGGCLVAEEVRVGEAQQHIRQSRPDSGLGVHVKVLKPFKLFPLCSRGGRCLVSEEVRVGEDQQRDALRVPRLVHHSSLISSLVHSHVTLNLEWCDKIYCCHGRVALSKAYNYYRSWRRCRGGLSPAPWPQPSGKRESSLLSTYWSESTSSS